MSAEEDDCSSTSSDNGALIHRSSPPAHPALLSSAGRGISCFVEEQLLRDIEAFGGIASANLASICNRKPEIYGESGSAFRKKIQNKVNQWKGFTVKRYRRVLDLYLIDAAAAAAASPNELPRRRVTFAITPGTPTIENHESPPCTVEEQQSGENLPSSQLLNFVWPLMSPTNNTQISSPSPAAVSGGGRRTSSAVMHMHPVIQAGEYG